MTGQELMLRNHYQGGKMPFEDSKLPFLPGDNLPKPNVGDTVITKDMPDTINDGSASLIVLRTYDSLAESWDPVGENAWAQHEVNETFGYKGHWYAEVHDPAYPEESWSVASWEVERIVPAE